MHALAACLAWVRYGLWIKFVRVAHASGLNELGGGWMTGFLVTDAEQSGGWVGPCRAQPTVRHDR